MLPNPTIFGHTYDWFELLVNLGMAVSFLIIAIRYKHWKSHGLGTALAFFVLLFVVITLGGRVMEAIEAILTDEAKYSFYEMVVEKKGGTRWYGNLLFGFTAVYLTIKITGKKYWLNLVDEILIGASAGVIIGKMGCFLSGHGCYGIPTNLPLGMRVTHGTMPSILPVHQTSLYDAIIYLILFIVLWRLANNKKYDGQITLVFLFVVCISSILVEIIRINKAVVLHMSMAQIVYAILLIATVIFYRNIKKKSASSVIQLR